MTPVNTKKWLVGSAVGVALGGALVAGVASVASADGTAAPSSPSSTSSTGTRTAPNGNASAVTVNSVRKDADGSYDVLGTKAGANVFYDVSSDLKTVTLRS